LERRGEEVNFGGLPHVAAVKVNQEPMSSSSEEEDDEEKEDSTRKARPAAAAPVSNDDDNRRRCRRDESPDADAAYNSSRTTNERVLHSDDSTRVFKGGETKRQRLKSPIIIYQYGSSSSSNGSIRTVSFAIFPVIR